MEFAPELTAMGVLTAADTMAFAALCTLAADVSAEDGVVKRSGSVIKSARGRPIPNPFVRMRDKHIELLIRLMEQFGMTPSSRGRIHVQPPVIDPNVAKYFPDR